MEAAMTEDDLKAIEKRCDRRSAGSMSVLALVAEVRRLRKEASTDRQLEPTPGWCERAASRIWDLPGCGELIAEYRAARQQPKTYTAAEAEAACRARPTDVVAVDYQGDEWSILDGRVFTDYEPYTI